MKTTRVLAGIVLCMMLLLSMTVFAGAHELVQDTEGKATVGPDNVFVREGDTMNAHTDFYLRVENPKPVTGTNLPRTGDEGVRTETLLLGALLCGGGYLACGLYEKKRKS